MLSHSALRSHAATRRPGTSLSLNRQLPDEVEGTFMRLQGGRGRRVVVKIDMVAAVATTELTPAQVEKI